MCAFRPSLGDWGANARTTKSSIRNTGKLCELDYVHDLTDVFIIEYILKEYIRFDINIL